MKFFRIMCSVAAFYAVFSCLHASANEKDIPDFYQFLQMAGTVEYCRPIVDTECRADLSRFSVGIRLGVYHPSDMSKMERVLKHAEAVALLLEGSAGIDISIDNANPNILLLSTDNETLNELIGLDDPLIDEELLNEFQVDLFSVGACAALASVFYVDGGFDEILGALVFVAEKKSEFELQRCISEEIVNSIGLFNDPQGHASLFDHPLHSVSPNQYLNETTLGFLQYLYTTNIVSRETWEDFWKSKNDY